MVEWVKAGMDPAAYWGLTYREIERILRGVTARIQAENEKTVSAAWITAKLSRAKRIPRLERLLKKTTPKRKMNPADLEAAARAWLSADREG